MMKDPENEVKPPYPGEIMPIRDAYELQICRDYLVDANAGLILQRCVNHRIDDIITSEDIGSNLNGLSVNLLGGEFKIDHVKWRPIDLNDYWDGREVSSEDLQSNYKYDPDFCGIYIKASEVDGKDFIYPKHYNDEKSFKEDVTAFVNKFAEYNRKQPEVELYFIVQVNHRPTCSNYWHCQIEVSKRTNPIAEPILEVKTKWEKKVLRAFRNFLLPYCSKECSAVIPAVDPSKYLKR